MRGRILQLDKGVGKLGDESGEIGFRIEQVTPKIKAGDIVELYGVAKNGVITVSAGRVLAPGGDGWDMGDWRRFNSEKLRENLRLRAVVTKAVQDFFSQGGFLSVETPTLIRGSAQEEHIQLFATESSGGKTLERLYLAPSPELHMKRMLGVGFERIYQISRSFRAGEIGPQHNPEFALVEWYRAFASYEEIIVDVENLVAYVAQMATGRRSVEREGREIALDPPWQRIGVHQAFARWADIDLRRCSVAETLYRRARELDYGSAGPDDSWEDLFHKISIEKIEPELAKMGAVHLVDYPRQLAALAKLKEGDPDIAERAEAYVGGIELANGYTELNDPVEQRRRFARQADAGGEGPPVDKGFLAAMEQGFPPAGGVALGLDRLVMLVAGASRLDEVIAFPQGL